MNTKKILTYSGIGLSSLALGAIEAAYDTPCFFKSALVAVPLISQELVLDMKLEKTMALI